MTQESASILPAQRKETLGEHVRKIADQLKQETELQIKATSRILGTAAQIAENHDRLIDEVVDMVEDDLEQQTKASQTNLYTVEALKQQFKTLNKAKSHFGLKANSWAALAKKLNDSSVQTSPLSDHTKPSVLERLDAIEGEISIIRAETSQILSLLKQFTFAHD
jgi:hypothetical protein